MSQTRNHLPAVNATSTAHQHAEVTTQLVKQNNRQDAFKVIYAADTGSATAYVMTPTPGIKFYDVGQPYEFKALHANTTTAPTLNINGLGAGTITKQGGAALAVGDIALGDFVSVICTSATPTFQLTSQAAPGITLTGATTFLTTTDTALATGGTWTNIVSTGSVGASGQTWLIMAVMVALKTDGQAFLSAAIFDGTSRVATAEGVNGAGTQNITVPVMKVVSLTGATTFTLQGTSSAANSLAKRVIANSADGNDKATSITAVRLA